MQRSAHTISVSLQDFTFHNGDEILGKIKNVQQVVERNTVNTNTMIGVYREQINYYSNSVTKYIENGYESDIEVINLDRWWEKRKSTFEKKIFFKKDYSARPWVFFTANKMKNFTVKSKKDGNKRIYNNDIIIDIVRKKLMTSYFTVEVTVIANEKVDPAEIDLYANPSVTIQYVVLNKF